MKLRSIRGPNCVEASVSATIVIENTTPTTVITARRHRRQDLARPSAPGWMTHRRAARSRRCGRRGRARRCRRIPAPRAAPRATARATGWCAAFSRRQAGIREVSERMSGVSGVSWQRRSCRPGFPLTALDVTGRGLRVASCCRPWPAQARAAPIKIQPEMARRLLSAVALAFLANVAIANATVSRPRTSPTRITARS